jgi:hypothetical protein
VAVMAAGAQWRCGGVAPARGSNGAACLRPVARCGQAARNCCKISFQSGEVKSSWGVSPEEMSSSSSPTSSSPLRNGPWSYSPIAAANTSLAQRHWCVGTDGNTTASNVCTKWKPDSSLASTCRTALYVKRPSVNDWFSNRNSA